MTITERLDLLRPMPTKQAIHETPWLTDALVRRDSARDRLRDWCAAGCPEPLGVDRVAFVGADAARSVIVDALHRIPAPPVRAHVLRHVLFVAVGFDVNAWCSPLPVLAHDLDEAPQMIAVGPILWTGDGPSVIAHEVAHAWLGFRYPATRDGAWARQTSEARAKDYMEKYGPASLREWEIQEERYACELARSWGFSGRGANPDRYAVRAVHGSPDAPRW